MVHGIRTRAEIVVHVKTGAKSRVETDRSSYSNFLKISSFWPYTERGREREREVDSCSL